jgi:hypothetical protein
MTDGDVAWSSLEFLSLAQALACLATGGRRDVAFHLSLAARLCCQCLKPAHVVDFVAVLGSLNLPLETRAAQALAVQLFKGVDAEEPATSAWAAALEFLEPHAACLQHWQVLAAKVESELTAPAIDIVLRFFGRGGRGPAISASHAKQALQKLSLEGAGIAFTAKVLRELEVLASTDESWAISSRKVRIPEEVTESFDTCSVAIMDFEFAGFGASGVGSGAQALSLPSSQKVHIRRSRPEQDDIGQCTTVPFLEEFVMAGASCATASALLQAFTELLSTAAGDAAAGEWRFMSGDALSMPNESPVNRERDSSDSEVFLLLAPNGYPCGMQELRVFRPQQHISGSIRIFCQGRLPSPEAWLLVAQLRRLIPRVVISIALDAPSGTASPSLLHATSPAAASPGRFANLRSEVPVPVGYERQIESTPPPTTTLVSPDRFCRGAALKDVLPAYDESFATSGHYDFLSPSRHHMQDVQRFNRHSVGERIAAGVSF